MTHDDIIIRASRLSRSYKKTVKAEGLSSSLSSLFRKETETVPALRDFDLELRRGDTLGVIGPNGAGKTTLVMGQKSQLWWDLPASDSFLLNRAIYGIP